uniref:Uncharacterized protein n=1 Tax=viral metagenome TaxID=1070528 RepID=A0A6M3L469_9ZZZZ
MGYLYSFNVVPTGALTATVRQAIVTVPAGALAWPHGLDIQGCAAIGCRMLVARHLVDDGAIGSDEVVVTGVTATHVNLNNLGGGAAQDVKLQCWLVMPHHGLNGSPLVPPRKVVDTDTPITVGIGATVALGDPLLSDDGVAPVVPLLAGHAPLDGAFWDWMANPTNPATAAITNNSAAAALEMNATRLSMYSVQRVPKVPPSGSCLYSIGDPVVVLAGAPLAYVHGLVQNGVKVIPDLEWLICVGGQAAGAVLQAAKWIEWTGHDDTSCNWVNNGSGGPPSEDVTVRACALYVHSSVRVPYVP